MINKTGYQCEPQPAVTDDGFCAWVTPKPIGYLMQCCDCNLIHEVETRVAKFQSRPSEDFVVVEDPDMQVQLRMKRRDDLAVSDVDRSKARVVCAAIRAADGSLLLGIRHYSRDMHEQITARKDGEKFKHRMDEDQGFVDQRGNYLSRYDAYTLAAENGQIYDLSACGEGLEGPKLYSEGLY